MFPPAASAASPLVFRSSASSAPRSSASARARMFKILLVVLKDESASLAGTRKGDVTRLHWSGSSGLVSGKGLNVIATVGGPEFFEEYPRGPAPREIVTRRIEFGN